MATTHSKTFCLIWLDASVNNSKENLQAQQQLRSIINHLVTFDDDQQCLQYISSASKDERFILITSGNFGRRIVPQIVSFPQIIAIYIYCMDKKANKEWSQQFSKVKGVVVRLDDLIERIGISYHQVQKQHKLDEALSISFSKADIQADDQSSTELNGQFIHSQLLIDCLIRMKSSDNEKEELIQFFNEKYKDNTKELKIIDEFERTYSSDRSLWWYTKESFVYRLLNKTLRTQDIDRLYLFRFFIRDLGLELEKHKCSLPVHVYRAQDMANEEIDKLKNSIGEYISMNSFLSTSLDSQTARSFLTSNNSSGTFEKVLFKIDADPRIKNIKPFANIKPFSCHPDEEEILFMIGSIFRIDEMVRDKQGAWNIRMVLCSTEDEQLQSLFQHMKNELGTEETNLIQFGHVLRDMGKLDEAEKYYRCYLKQLPDDHLDRSLCYHALGKVTSAKGDYKSSLKWFHKSLKMNMETLESDNPNIACDHNSIATIHFQTDDDTSALQSYKKALDIWNKTYGKDHICIAACLDNMGTIYVKQENYAKALKCYEKALIIRQKHLPNNHIDLGNSHNNIGNVNYYLDHYDDALEHYNIALKIKFECLPSQHPSIAMTLENIGSVYKEKENLPQALSYFKKAAKIFHHSLPSTHPNVIKIDQSIERISSQLTSNEN